MSSCIWIFAVLIPFYFPFGEAKELIGCVNWLVNDEAASFVTGITVPVDGGFLSSAGL